MTIQTDLRKFRFFVRKSEEIQYLISRNFAQIQVLREMRENLSARKFLRIRHFCQSFKLAGKKLIEKWNNIYLKSPFEMNRGDNENIFLAI